MKNENEIERCLLGEQLYGDDFTIEEIHEWVSDEAEGSADVAQKDKAQASYRYHQLDYHHGFRFLAGRHFENALGIGSSCGEEFKPIAKTISSVTILSRSKAVANTNDKWGVPCAYHELHASGDIEFESNSFDLITSLGALPHIPNVSHVLNECTRCLTKGGIMLLREPIVSMGDWRKPRPGLTKRERGIPAHLLEQIIKKAGLTTVRRSPCVFPVVLQLANIFGVAAYNNPPLTVTDAMVSQLFSWNRKYHRVSFFEKFGPACVYYVLTK